MKLVTSVILLFLISSSVLIAQQNNTRFFFNYNQEQVTVAATSIGLTSSILKPSGQVYQAEMVTMRVTCAVSSPCNIRLRMDGSAATTTTGIMFKENSVITIYGYQNLSQLRMIREGANSATVQVLFYR